MSAPAVPCKYGASCYRQKNPAHSQQYSHPSHAAPVSTPPLPQAQDSAPSAAPSASLSAATAVTTATAATAATPKPPAALVPDSTLVDDNDPDTDKDSSDAEDGSPDVNRPSTQTSINDDPDTGGAAAASVNSTASHAPDTGAAPVSAGAPALPPCIYGTTCYRQSNPRHTAQYSHSAGPTPPVAPLKHKQLSSTSKSGSGASSDDNDDNKGTRRSSRKRPANDTDNDDDDDDKDEDADADADDDDEAQIIVTTKKSKKPRIVQLGSFDDIFDPATSTASSSSTRSSHLINPSMSAAIVGEKSVPGFLLAKSWNPESDDPKDWFISEKLDGVRAMWNPVKKSFYTRLGNPLSAPRWFTKDLPNFFLDGELFSGRSQFAQTVSIVRSQDSPHWDKIVYHCFDAPNLSDKVFEDRLAEAQKYFAAKPVSHVKIVRHEPCKSVQQLKDMLDQVLDRGGEGLMLRQPQSMYEGRRSPTLLKVKAFYEAEARVTGHQRGTGRNSSVMGALMCVMASGATFKVGTGFTDAQRRNPPKIGSIITYRFQELSKSGNPRFPSYVGVRIDMTQPKDAVIRLTRKDRANAAADDKDKDKDKDDEDGKDDSS